MRMTLAAGMAVGLLWAALPAQAATPRPATAARPAAAAHAIADPQAFVTSVYRRLAASPDYSPPTDIYSPRLKALWADMKHDAGDEVGRMDFEFWTNAQDWEIRNVAVSSAPVEGNAGRKVVTAKFANGDRQEQIRFYFERVGGRWLLDDARSIDKEGGWTLSLILKYGFDGG